MRPDVALIDVPFQTTPADRALVRNGLIVLGGACALVLGAKATIPLEPVPFTLQSLVLFVIGAAFGMKRAVASVGAYLVAGLAGAPVFSATTIPGPAAFFGPTGGFLIGFVASVAVIGFLADRGWDRSFWRTIAAMSAGTVVLFGFGMLWLATLTFTVSGETVEHGFAGALAIVAPLLPFAGVKMLIASVLLPSLWSMVGKPSDEN